MVHLCFYRHLRGTNWKTEYLINFALSLCIIFRPKNKQVTKNVFELNEMVLISGKEPEFIAMASGVVKEINPNFITVETERCSFEELYFVFVELLLLVTFGLISAYYVMVAYNPK